MSPWALALAGWAAMAAVMAGLWLLQRRTGKAGVVDVGWSFGVGALGVAFAAMAGGFWERRLLVALLVGFWSARLGTMLLLRVSRSPEDGRYARLVQRWGASAQRNLFVFFQVQAAWTVLFALPACFAAENPRPWLGWTDLAGLAVGLLAIAGEGLADRQLAAFKRDPSNRGRVCRTGLWRYSRHPNYFFEWMFWWSFVLIGIGGPHGLLTLGGPAVMLLFLYRVTGIPYTEMQAVSSRGEAYREYQRTTSAFVPWFPRRTGS